jgi:hypothetical protein
MDAARRRSGERKVEHMQKRIARQTPRTLRHAAAWILLSLALPCAAFAFKSAYSSISVPGNFDDGPSWNTGTHQLTLVSDNVWLGVLDVTKNGNFKFAANNSWAVNWGRNYQSQKVSSVPTEDSPLNQGGEDIPLELPAGQYRFMFFEETTTFSVLPIPSYSKVQLIGNFNDSGALTNGTMSASNGVWVATLDLDSGATVSVLADGITFGARNATDATLSKMPSTLALLGTIEATLACRGGTFEFTADFRSNLLSVVQTWVDTNFTFAAAGADGTFACGDETPGQNLEDNGDNWWSGEFQVEQDRFTLRFVGHGTNGVVGRWWGFPAGTTISTLPADGTLTASDTPDGAAFATFDTGAGDYTFRFNPQSGSYMVRKRALSNLLANASFEKLDDKGNPTDWGLYHAGSAPSSVYDAHSGTNSAVLNRLYDDWDNLGNIDQSVALKNQDGLPFRVAASFRCGGSAWHGDTVRIIVEWKVGNEILREDSTEVLNLSPAWQTVALETTVPTNNVTAHILFKYDGAQVGETVLIDDAFAGIAASRTQNFDAWGRHDNFEKIDPDWSASSAKTILNAASTIPGGVIISRYIESVGNTKAIEIFNGTTNAINLKNDHYYLQQYDNGSTTPTVTIPLTNGTIPANKTFAITRTFPSGSKYPPDSALRQFGDIKGLSSRILRTDALTFNGDDVIVLRKGTASGRVVDRVGQVGANATGSLWSRMASDHTLVRNGTVTNGNTGAVTGAFDLSEWTVLDNGDFGDLGAHAFTDPNAGYLPSGYSLLLDTGANLTTPALEGGIGDISFLARAQGSTNGTGSDLQLAIETAPDEYSTAWTTVATVAIPLSETTFTRHECSAGNSAHTVVRFRHIADSTTNRIRLDDIEIGRAYRIKRTENFAAWTDAAYRTDGLHTVAQWTLSGRVATNGVSGTLAGNLPVDSGYLQTPTFDGGVGQITFALCRTSTNDSVQVTLSTSGDGGATWDEVQTFEYPAKTKGTTTNLSAWVYVPSNGCARFTCAGGTADAILDNISVGMPSTSREIDFDDFAPDTGYKSYAYKGWTLTETAINNTANAWSGNSGLLRDAGIIASPYIDTIGSISFMYRKGVSSGDDKARLKVEVSADNKKWTVLADSLAGTDEWQAFNYVFSTNASWHYARISQSASYTSSTHRRIFIDDIALNDYAPVPSVSFSSTLDPAYPTVNESFRLLATAYPRNGADILSVTGYVKIASGRVKPMAMTPAGAGEYVSAATNAPSGGNDITYHATVWYGGVGVVPGNPGYAVTNLSTPATTVTVSSVKSGEVWINEIFYERSPYDDLTGDWDWDFGANQDHEFVEICGKAGTDIGNWKIQLAYATSADIAAHSNQAIYATYTIPAGKKIPDTGNGYGFWLLADTEIEGANQTLDKFDPLEDEFFIEIIRSHIRDAAGVIRLVNQYGGVMHSISYGAYADSSEKLPVSQTAGIDNEFALSLAGTGGLCSDFAWTTQEPTPGSINENQTLDGTVTVPFLPIWHSPALRATTAITNFFLFDPPDAVQSDPVVIYFAYTNRDFPDYNLLGGTLHHHRRGASGAWQTTSKDKDFPRNTNPTNGEAYFKYDFINHHTYHRGETMEYVIEATANRYSDTFLGTEDGTTSVAYETLDEAKLHPFTHDFPVAVEGEFQIRSFSFRKEEGTIRIETESPDTIEPVQEFQILATTNLLLPKGDWTVYKQDTDFGHDVHLEEAVCVDGFTLVPPGDSSLHFAIKPVR